MTALELAWAAGFFEGEGSIRSDTIADVIAWATENSTGFGAKEVEQRMVDVEELRQQFKARPAPDCIGLSPSNCT